MSHITTDQKTTSILMLYEADRLRERITPREQIIYRIQVEGIVGSEDHLMRFEWDDDLRRLGIQLLHKEDLTLDQATTREEQWAYYVDSYYMHADTEGVATDLLSAPWLRRSVKSNEFPLDANLFINELQVKICLNTYKLFYLVTTEDTLVRAKNNRNINEKRLNYNRAARVTDGSKWTRDGTHTKEEQNAAAAAAEAAKEHLVPNPASLTAPDVQVSPPLASSVTPAPQTDAPRSSITPNPPAPASEEPAPSGDVKIESPPNENGEAMDLESSQPKSDPPEPRAEEPRATTNEDVEMADA